MLHGLGGIGDTYRKYGADYSDSTLLLIMYFERYGFALYSYICLLLAAFLLRLTVAARDAFARPAAEQAGKAKNMLPE